jgi:hypothetical protein
MRKQNGFTTVELIISFALTMVIMAFLFEILLSLKELYVSTTAKTDLLTKQILISRKINDDIYNKTITDITNCGNECLNFIFSDGTNSELSIDRDRKIFKYGSYTTKLIELSEYGTPTVNSETIYDVGDGKNNTIIQIKIPITHPAYKDEDYGINVIYQYDNRIYPIADFSFSD